MDVCLFLYLSFIQEVVLGAQPHTNNKHFKSRKKKQKNNNNLLFNDPEQT